MRLRAVGGLAVDADRKAAGGGGYPPGAAADRADRRGALVKSENGIDLGTCLLYTSFPSFGGGVFVLTTLSAHHGSTEEIDEFIQGLCNVKVSGIGIKLGRFVNEIPASTIRLAREANVPIVALSSTVYFREILSDTLSVITGNQQQMLNRINALSRTMVNAIVENQNIQQLLRLFCQEVNCYCCCMDLSGRWIAEAASLCGVFDTKEVKRELENYIAQQGQVRQLSLIHI